MRRATIASFILFLLFPAVALAQSSDIADGDEILLRINGSDAVANTEAVNVAVIVEGDLEIAGAVQDVAIVINGDMTALGGSIIDGNLIVIDGTLTLRDGSRVSGDIFLSNDATWIVEDGATFTGAVEQGDLSPDLDDDVAWQLVIATLAGWFGLTLIAIAVAVVFAGIGGRQLWSSAANLTARPGATVIAALAFWLGLFLLVIPIVLSFVALLALPLIALIGFVVWYLGYVAFGTRLGASITGQRTADTSVAHPYLAAVAGVVVLQLVLLLAISGFLVAALVAWFGDGSSGLSVVFGIPALIFHVIIWLAGIVGGGALVLRAMSAWTAPE